MNITCFTSNQPRHINLIELLSNVADTVYAVQECNTVFPGEIKDLYDNSKVMGEYFQKVREAEYSIFGHVDFARDNVRTLSLKSGDLSKCSKDILEPALQSDFYIVFGASYIKGWLIDFLIKKRAVNIHMGVSPFYRGSACNFWALYDNHPELVGATIILLSKGLDSGDILYHALPKSQNIDPFALGMEAVRIAQESVCEMFRSGRIALMNAIKQNREQELRYSKGSDFTDEIAREYMNKLPSKEEIRERLDKRNEGLFTRPFII